MGTRWRSFEESAELALETPSTGVKLLKERTQLINPSVGRGKGFKVALKMIRLPRSLAAQSGVAEISSQPPSTVGEATNVSQGDIEKQGSSTTTVQKRESAYRPTRGRGRGKNRSSSPTRRPNGQEARRTTTVGQESALETNLDELQEEGFLPSTARAREQSSFSLKRLKDEFPTLAEAVMNSKDKQAVKKEMSSKDKEFISSTKSSEPTREKEVEEAPVSALLTSPEPSWPLNELTLVFENLPGDMLPKDFLDLIQPFGEINNHHLFSDGTHCKAFVQLCSADCCEWVQSCLNGTATLDGDQPMLISYANIP